MHNAQTNTFIQRIQSMPTWALVLLTAIYAVSPLDLVPDPICGVGLLDDVGVVSFTVVTLLQRWLGSSTPITSSNTQHPMPTQLASMTADDRLDSSGGHP